MSYNDNGSPFGGFGFPMPIPMPFFGGSGGGNNCGFGDGISGMFGMMMLFLFFSLFGFGGLNGGRGGMPFPLGGMMPFGGAAGNTAAEAAAYVGAQNTADKVSAIATGVDAIAGIATANGVKLETVKDQNAAAFSNLNTSLCQSFNAQTMQGMNMHNATTALLNDMRAEAAKCWCENKQLLQSSFCDLRHQLQVDKCDTLQAISASTAAITARLDAAEKAALQDKLNAANERIATLKAERDNSQQTQQLLAAIQAYGCAPRCAPAPCQPCGCAPAYTRSNCEDPVCTLVNSLVTRWANAQEIPATPAAS